MALYSLMISTPFLLAVLVVLAPPNTHSQPIRDESSPEPSRLILILLDGFRWDYPDLPLNLPGLTRFIQEGTRAEYMESTYPTVSYTNYMSIASGLWTESNGIMSNYIYDPDTNQTFWIGTQPSDFDYHWFKDAEPIWVTAEKANKATRMLDWPGCSVNFSGVQPSYYKEYTQMPLMQNFSWSINTTLEEMRAGNIMFAGIYFEMTDKYGHNYGPKSPELNAVIEEVDTEISRLLTYLDETKMADGSGKMADLVNVILVSDHGMHELPLDNKVDLEEYVDRDDVLRYLGPGHEAVAQLWPKEDKLGQVYESLHRVPHMTVYKKEDIPTRWHFKNNKRAPPLLLVADDNWKMKESQHNYFHTQWGASSPTSPGMHGYPPEQQDMQGIFLAWGPDIAPKHTQPHFANIEVYQLMCAILGIQPAPHNGTWANIEHVLRSSASSGSGRLLVDWTYHHLCTLVVVLYHVGHLVQH